MKKFYTLALWLAACTIVYNIAEGTVATWLGFDDEMFTLFGFGVDSFVEVISGIGIIHMVIRIKQQPDKKRDRFERTALKITGTAFYLLVAGLVTSSALIIYFKLRPVATRWGILISAISILVMWALIYGKIKTGRALNSEAILADAACTKVCIYMSLVLLLASGLYELTRLPYLDAAGTLGLAFFSFREGKECFEKARSEKYCAC